MDYTLLLIIELNPEVVMPSAYIRVTVRKQSHFVEKDITYNKPIEIGEISFLGFYKFHIPAKAGQNIIIELSADIYYIDDITDNYQVMYVYEKLNKNSENNLKESIIKLEYNSNIKTFKNSYKIESSDTNYITLEFEPITTMESAYLKISLDGNDWTTTSPITFEENGSVFTRFTDGTNYGEVYETRITNIYKVSFPMII